MISSGRAGPLGVLHLPLFWLKVSLEEQVKLAPGYPGIGKSFGATTARSQMLSSESRRAQASEFAKQAPMRIVEQPRRLVQYL
jgi:hypothetical protein